MFCMKNKIILIIQIRRDAQKSLEISENHYHNLQVFTKYLRLIGTGEKVLSYSASHEETRPSNFW